MSQVVAPADAAAGTERTSGADGLRTCVEVEAFMVCVLSPLNMRAGRSFDQSMFVMRYIHSMNITGLNLNLLPVLDALLAERSVSRAGTRLGLSQPAVSNALAQLRAVLG